MADRDRPNILFLLSDDQGYWSLGSYGNREVISENLDALAEEGTVFDSFYCTSPVCSPARASLLTGKMPSQHGVLDWLGAGLVPKEEYEKIRLPRRLILENLDESVTEEEIPDTDLLPFSLTRNYRRYMKNESLPKQYLKDRTLSGLLKENGYECGLAGKWHLGMGNIPQAGYSFWSVIPRGGAPYRLPDYYTDGKLHIEERYITDLITDEALRFLDQRDKERPFLLSVHYTAPHDPWRKQDHPKEIWDLYENCPFDSIPKDVNLHKDQVMKRPVPRDAEHLREMIQAYYSSITAMDRSIGELIQRLKDEGIYEDTLIVFTSDNGMNFGHHGIYGKGNGTYPMNLYETSVRIPCILKAKDLPSSRIDVPYSHYDLFPTILEYAGIPYQDDDLPGRSILSSLKQNEKKDAVVIYDEYGPMRMIRKGSYKLIYNCLSGHRELYDLKDDPEEKNDLAGENESAELIDSLIKEMNEWFAKYSRKENDGSQYPVNGEGQFDLPQEWRKGKKVFVEQDNTPILFRKEEES